MQERGGKGSLPSEAVDFSGRIKELRGDIIDAIRQLLHAHCVKEIRLPEEDYDPVWVIWFGKNGEPYECRVTGLRVTADSLTVLAEEKESGDGVQCHSPFELGAKNIDWLHEMYEAVWHQLRENKQCRITNRRTMKYQTACREHYQSDLATHAVAVKRKHRNTWTPKSGTCANCRRRTT